MDHFPPVGAGAYNPVTVPYLGGTYHGHGFTNFPLPPTIDLAALSDENTPLEQVQHAAADLQVWFYFGLLHEVLDLPIVVGHFVKNDPTSPRNQLITTERLREYMARWKTVNDEAKRDTTGQQLHARNQRVIDCLETAFVRWQSIPRFTTIVGEKVELSIQLLACALENMVNCASDVAVQHLQWRHTENAFLTRRMVDDGWCPALVRQISRPCRLPWQYYSSLLGPPRYNRHGRDATCEPGDPGCRIKLSQIHDSDYAPKHVCDTGHCLHISPVPLPDTTPSTSTSTSDAKPTAPQDVAAIIKAGGIPLLRYDPSTATLFVEPYREGLQYTAISHVWTDGMGNPYENSIPRCQLKRLHESMSMIPWTTNARVSTNPADMNLVWPSGEHKTVNLSPDANEAAARPLLFWIDTICVPREEDARKMTINNMRFIYNRANRVLVFDAELTDVHAASNVEDIMTRISHSNWIRRFWTLQEAMMAKILWFRFADDCYRSMPDGHTDFEPYYDNEIQYHCQEFNFDSNHHASSMSYVERVNRIWLEIQKRSSRFDEDRPVCVATLLDMDLNVIQDTPAADRMCKLWSMYEAVPTAVIFLVTPRLQQVAYRWAPASLSTLSPLPAPFACSAAVPTAQGLAVTHHGIITTASLSGNRFGVIALKIDDQVYLIRQNTKQSQPSWAGYEPSPVRIDFGSYDRLAVLISQVPVTREEDRQPFERALGALVGISTMPSTTSDDGEPVIKCEYLRAVSVLLKGSLWEYRYQAKWEDWEEREKEQVTAAQFTPVQQKWLIT